MAGGPQRSATRQVYYILFVIAPGLCLAASVSASFPFWTQSALRAWLAPPVHSGTAFYSLRSLLRFLNAVFLPSASFAIVKFLSHLQFARRLYTIREVEQARPWALTVLKVRSHPKMQQDPVASRLYDALETWQTCTCKSRSGLEDDEYPFIRDSVEFYFIVQEEAAHVRRKSVGVGTAKCVPLDIFTDYQYDLWDTTDSPQIHPISVLLWSCASAENVKNLLPEVCHPHSQDFIKIYGIPFPTCMRNIIVSAASEVDSWNSYYFVEDPDVKPYVAGLTCVPYVNLMEPD